MFKLGHEIILITDQDKFEWGKIEEITDDGVTLKRDRKKSREWKWDNVAFMSHDGFPVRKLPPSPSDEHVEKLLGEKHVRDLKSAIRQALAFSTCADCGKLIEDNSYNAKGECNACHRRYSYQGGHPWEIECVSSQIFNIGNQSPSDWLWSNHPLEETIVMQSKDGLGGQLWDLPAIFEFEQHVAIG